MYFLSVIFYLPFIFFFFNDTATTEIYTLSLHDALPIWPVSATWQMISSLVRHTCTVPPPPVWHKVLAASSLAAITKSGMRGGVSPAHLALLATKRRTGRRRSPAGP